MVCKGLFNRTTKICEDRIDSYAWNFKKYTNDDNEKKGWHYNGTNLDCPTAIQFSFARAARGLSFSPVSSASFMHGKAHNYIFHVYIQFVFPSRILVNCRHYFVPSYFHLTCNMSWRSFSNIKSCIFHILLFHFMVWLSRHWCSHSFSDEHLTGFQASAPYRNARPDCFTSWCPSASSSLSGALVSPAYLPEAWRGNELTYRKCFNRT